MTDSIPAIVAEMRAPENSGRFGPWEFTAENIKEWADRLEALGDVERDAARYRWLIEKGWVQFEVDWRLGIDPDTVAEYGPAIDTAMTGESHD